MPFVDVTVLYDNNLQYFPSGKLMSIPTDSQVMGTRSLPAEYVIPGTTGMVSNITLLQVKTIAHDMLYLDMTQDEYNLAVAEASASANAELTKVYVVGTDVPSSAVIVDEALANATINAIAVDGVVLNLETVDYDSGGQLTFPGVLSDGTVVTVLYWKI